MIKMNQATLDFIQQHRDGDVRQLALMGGRHPEVDLRFALEQIAGWQKAREKLPSWAAVDGIVYPPHLSMEQCSSEATARYKAMIVGEGALFVDLTAGLGVDAAFISEHFSKAVTVEQQAQLCAISSENFRVLGLNHIEVVCGNGIDYLHSMAHADLLFIDPARRDEHGGRTYGVADCTPNVLELIDEMKEKADRILIKLSPMLDWRKAVEDIPGVTRVHIVSVANECKELLLEVNSVKSEAQHDAPSLQVVCVNLLSDGSDERFGFSVPTTPSAVTSRISVSSSHCLYEPNASIMKAGCFSLIAEAYHVCQLDSNSHLFVSDTEVEDFPGRKFEVTSVMSMNKRELKQAFSDLRKANITVRNFPMTVQELRKRLRLQDGGDVYIFATTVAGEGHQLFVCRKKS